MSKQTMMCRLEEDRRCYHGPSQHQKLRAGRSNGVVVDRTNLTVMMLRDENVEGGVNDAECRMQNAEYRIQNTGSPLIEQCAQEFSKYFEIGQRHGHRP